MDCMLAQQTVSDALDNASADAAPLELAKEHCRTCDECGAFVRTLVALRRAAAPEPPADLVDRIMATVTAEHARAERAGVAIASVRRADIGHTGGPDQTNGTRSILQQRLLDPRNRRSVVSWMSAAAIVLIAAGFGAVTGVRSILAPSESDQNITILESTAVEGGDAAASAAQQTYGATPDMATKSAEIATSGFIVVNEVAYRSAGKDATVEAKSLAPLGTAETTLLTGSTPRSESVLGSDDPARVFIEDAEGAMLAFDRVTTSYEGRTYVLHSGPILSFGEMVTLPATLTEPDSSDGSPTFEAAAGISGSGVYLLKGRDATNGIAFAPGSKPELSAGWTWWLPAAQ